MKRFSLLLLAALLLTVVTSGCELSMSHLALKKPEDAMNVSISPKTFFEGNGGTFVLRDLSNNSTIIFNEKQANKRVSPLFSFAVCQALIGLHTGVITDEDASRKWDGTLYRDVAWNKDQTLATALKHSVAWYFQSVSTEIGEKQMEAYLKKMKYGNQEIGGGLDRFWVSGNLKITALEQADFLAQLYQEKLPFDQSVMKTVKRLMLRTSQGELQYAGLAGSGEGLGWYVGYVAIKGKPYVFATNIEGGKEASGRMAQEATELILQEMKLLPKETDKREAERRFLPSR